MTNSKPTLYTCLSPALLHLYDVRDCVVVVIDVLRATSTMATVLYNGAKEIIPVDSVERCIQLGRELACITAGERDGQVAPGLQYGNSSFEYPREFIAGKTLVLTTTNGTKLLHMALAKGATEIITGAFLNLSAVCDHLVSLKKNVILGCAAWKDKPNIEDTLFAGAVVSRIKEHFSVNCDASHMAECLYGLAKDDMYEFMKRNDASHYHRLTNFGLEKDIRHCLTADQANVLPEYVDGKLVAGPLSPKGGT
ncbi:2-phosphosulfolactate phosphatase [Flaviaesturariibacter aridisoli]|uniref:Probable 2-phosphosulfolactate phosphatase n=1 Tax=Flaviaesturariibacter aridisoli TaxID=2545761 RepID=A0A4R4DZ89_9BACT|nr:2-phosphosulfolactate phosphatase [Flaviaesturariibacter aridisoli]TCZ71749.1 2-phosphosulfolactate phosphatase [Flaviaesturariibacter aridisoli]